MSTLLVLMERRRNATREAALERAHAARVKRWAREYADAERVRPHLTSVRWFSSPTTTCADGDDTDDLSAA